MRERQRNKQIDRDIETQRHRETKNRDIETQGNSKNMTEKHRHTGRHTYINTQRYRDTEKQQGVGESTL